MASPNAHMTLSTEGAAAIKLWEHGNKPALRAYNDGTGTWTIGYGATKGVRRGMTITPAQADEMFDAEIAVFIAAVHRLITRTISQGLFDALVSFFYNCGYGNCKTLIRAVNAGDDAKIRAAFLIYTRAYSQKLGRKTVWPGLVSRRQKELAHWADLDSNESAPIEPKLKRLPPATEPSTIEVATRSRSAWALINANLVLVAGYLTDWGTQAIDFASGLFEGVPDITTEVFGIADRGAKMSNLIGFDWGRISFSVVVLCLVVALVRHVRDKRLLS